MKVLKIENGRGHFSTDGNTWNTIDVIEKLSLMKILNLVLEGNAELDEFNPDLISNPADQIIYKSIYDKFKQLFDSRSKFKDESDRTYMEEIAKYSA